MEKAYKNLLEFKKILDNLGVVFCLDGGTLLGFYRDGCFCEDDHDDVDLTTDAFYEPFIPMILEKANNLGFETYHSWDSSETTSAQISVKRNNLKMDLMFKKFKGDRAWWTVYTSTSHVYKSVPAHHFKNFDKLTVKDTEFNIPKDIDSYLDTRYGDWQTPVHRKDYHYAKDDLSIRGSYEEI